MYSFTDEHMKICLIEHLHFQKSIFFKILTERQRKPIVLTHVLW